MKLNNKGFAISTVLYALLIMVFLIVILMMSIMASNRKATKSLVSTIEAELNRYNQSATTIAYDEATTYQTYIIPSSGWYKIELYGAEGGGINGTTIKGGKGAYTSGIIYLDIGTELSFYIGGKASGNEGGTNGGGTGKGNGMGGGGATDVRVGSDIRQRIMVAAGGGGATQYNGASATGGDGGGLIGKSGASTNTSASNYTVATGGNQTGPYVQNSVLSGNKTLEPNSGYLTGTSDAEKGLASGKIGEGGKAQVDNAAGGGGGYIGGGAGAANDNIAGSGAGGSSFISGYAGTGIKNANNEALFTETNYYFIDGKMSSGVNEGSGKARITLVSNATKDERPAAKNTILNNVKKIESCSTGSTADATSVIWSEIVAKSNGETVVPNSVTSSKLNDGIKSSYSKNVGSNNCVSISFNSAKTLDEIAVYHSTDDKYAYNEQLKITYADGNYKYLINFSGKGKMVLASDGAIRYTAWDIDYTQDNNIPNGVYQIESVLTISQSVLSAYNNNVIPAKPEDCDEKNLSQECIEYEKTYADKHAGLQPLGTENKSQKWAITKIAGTESYRIIETESNKALQIKDSIGLAKTAVNTSSNYGDISSQGYEWTRWTFLANGDGTYIIKTAVGDGNCLSTTSESFDVLDSDVNINTCDYGSFLSRRWILRPVSY